MSDATTHLLLPYILAAQAQKHVAHNEALRLLDGLVQLSVLDRDLTAPPGSLADGDRYIVASGATGDWASWDLNVALWTDGAWLRLPARTGWRAWVEDEGLLLVYDGADWIGTAPAALQNLALLGVGTIADAANPFSAKLNAALWTAKTVAEGGTGDLFYTMNKEAAGDDLGLMSIPDQKVPTRRRDLGQFPGFGRRLGACAPHIAGHPHQRPVFAARPADLRRRARRGGLSVRLGVLAGRFGGRFRRS